jgi:hypothetical protein
MSACVRHVIQRMAVALNQARLTQKNAAFVSMFSCQMRSHETVTKTHARKHVALSRHNNNKTVTTLN